MLLVQVILCFRMRFICDLFVTYSYGILKKGGVQAGEISNLPYGFLWFLLGLPNKPGSRFPVTQRKNC